MKFYNQSGPQGFSHFLDDSLVQACLRLFRRSRHAGISTLPTMNHVKYGMKIWGPADQLCFAFSKLVHRQYKSFQTDRFCQIEIQKTTGLKNISSNA